MSLIVKLLRVFYHIFLLLAGSIALFYLLAVGLDTVQSLLNVNPDNARSYEVLNIPYFWAFFLSIPVALLLQSLIGKFIRSRK